MAQNNMNTYRGYLQYHALNHPSATKRAEAQALLNVVGDDMNIDGRFLTGTGTNSKGQTVGEQESNGFKASTINRQVNPWWQESFKGYQKTHADDVERGVVSGGNSSRTQSSGGSYNTQSTGVDANKMAVNKASRDATQSAIDSLEDEQSVGNENIDDEYNTILSKYDKETSRAKADSDEQRHTNTSNLLKGKQNSLLAAAQGRRGLNAVLASIGALGGTGKVLADRAVQKTANADLGKAGETHASNARMIDKNWSDFKDEDDDRRSELDTSRDNQKTALEGEMAIKRQGLLQEMAELFGDIGDANSASKYLEKAGGLNKLIAEKGRVKASPITSKRANFKASDLQKYLAGSGDMTVKLSAGNSNIMNPTVSAGLKAERKQDEEI